MYTQRLAAMRIVVSRKKIGRESMNKTTSEPPAPARRVGVSALGLPALTLGARSGGAGCIKIESEFGK